MAITCPASALEKGVFPFSLQTGIFNSPSALIGSNCYMHDVKLGFWQWMANHDERHGGDSL